MQGILRIVVYSALSITLAKAQDTPYRSLSSDLAKLRFEKDLTSGTVEDWARTICRHLKSAGGIVVKTPCAGSDVPMAPITLPAGTTVKDALGALHSARSDYQWSVSDGDVLNVLPADPPRLLATPIVEYRWDLAQPVRAAFAGLLELSAVRLRAQELDLDLGVSVGPGVISEYPNPTPPLPEFRVIRDVTLLSALNAVAESYGSVVWLYRERSCSGQHIVSVGPFVMGGAGRRER